MPVWSMAEARCGQPQRPGLPAVLVAFALCCMSVATVLAKGIEVRQASGEAVKGVYTVDADVSCELGARAIDALKSGIALAMILEVRIERRRVWPLPWSELVAELRQEYTIRQHALSGQFIVSNTATGERHSYRDIGSALEGLGAVRALAVVPLAQLPRATLLRGRLRMGLDIEALPAPMRPLAYIGWGWQLTSPWFNWDLQT
jgi:hypothetical protein